MAMSNEQIREWSFNLGWDWSYIGINMDGHGIFEHNFKNEWWVIDPKTGRKRLCIREEDI